MQSSTEPSPLFFVLSFDIRHRIYTTILHDAGIQQHILCPSVVPRRLPDQQRLGKLLSKKCDLEKHQETLSCGHYVCEYGDTQQKHKPAEGSPNRDSSGFTINDLNSLMKTCKFAYVRHAFFLLSLSRMLTEPNPRPTRYQEVAEFLYRSVNFTFSSFTELKVFLDRISPRMLPSIRSITFVAHMLPESAEICLKIIEGHYFQGAGPDYVALFKRTVNLRSLEVLFFPNLMMLFSTRFASLVKPLEAIADRTKITVTIPRVYLCTGYDGDGLPLPGQLEGETWCTVRRPTVVAPTGLPIAGCKAYEGFS